MYLVILLTFDIGVGLATLAAGAESTDLLTVLTVDDDDGASLTSSKGLFLILLVLVVVVGRGGGRLCPA